jgi:predicted RNA-binding Zn ribbon-like protein
MTSSDAPAEGTYFHLLGEPLSLELANTTPEERNGDTEDLIRDPNDAVAWLAAEGLPRPDDPELAFEELLSLRSAIRVTAEALISDSRPTADALHTLNEVAARGPSTPLIRYRRGGLDVVENLWATPLDDALGRIARDAVRLLGGPRSSQIKQCEGPGCLLLFLASNPRRRWCSSKRCGNRVRVARHHKRPSPGRPRYS